LPKVSFVDHAVEFECKPGERLSEVAAAHGIDIFRGIWHGFNCRTLGLCGRCEVWVQPASKDQKEALSPPTFVEKLFHKQPYRPQSPWDSGNHVPALRLACQARVQGDIEVRTRPGSGEIKQDLTWEPDPRHFKWQDRLKAKDEEEEEGAPKKAAPVKKAAPAAKPAAADPAKAPNGATAAATPAAAPAVDAPAEPKPEAAPAPVAAPAAQAPVAAPAAQAPTEAKASTASAVAAPAPAAADAPAATPAHAAAPPAGAAPASDPAPAAEANKAADATPSTTATASGNGPNGEAAALGEPSKD
jgi:ferredoxin